MIRAACSVRSPLYDVRKHASASVRTTLANKMLRGLLLHATWSSSRPTIKPSGGARRDRTDDLMLAKHALSQLSYGPVTRRRMLNACARSTAGAARFVKVVGLGRLELPTSRLSSARSNQLSYKPLRRGEASGGIGKATPTSRRLRRVFVREERETKTAASRQWSSPDLAI